MSFLTSPQMVSSLSTRSIRHSARSGARMRSRNFVERMDAAQAHWSDAEDVYWRWQYAREPYFVAGRSYKEYRPAYMLGSRFAWAFSEANFQALRNAMACEWDVEHGESHLAWSEVEPAAHVAWERAVMRQPGINLVPHFGGGRAHMQRPLQAVVQACMALAQDMEQMQSVPMDDFLKQILDRHALMLRRFVQTLAQHGVAITTPDASFTLKLKLQIAKVAAKWTEIQVKNLLATCVLREEALGALYTRALRAELPLELGSSLKQQAHMLKHNREKLVWVQNNWVF